MSKAAALCTKLGNHMDALVLQEQVLELNSRVLPEDHPDIGYTVFPCAITILKLMSAGTS
jgi:hypothetical protein